MSGSLKQVSQKAHAIVFSWNSEDLSLALPTSQSRHWAFTILGSFHYHQGTRLWRWKRRNWDIKYYRVLASSFTEQVHDTNGNSLQIITPVTNHNSSQASTITRIKREHNPFNWIYRLLLLALKIPISKEKKICKENKVHKIAVFHLFLKLLTWVVNTGLGGVIILQHQTICKQNSPLFLLGVSSTE